MGNNYCTYCYEPEVDSDVLTQSRSNQKSVDAEGTKATDSNPQKISTAPGMAILISAPVESTNTIGNVKSDNEEGGNSFYDKLN